MNANEALAEVYDAGRPQIVSVDGEFWCHEAGGNWQWRYKFDRLPDGRVGLVDCSLIEDRPQIGGLADFMMLPIRIVRRRL